MQSRDTDDTCTATCKDGSECNAYPVSGNDKCRMHLGTSADGSSHESNGHAVKHNLSASRDKLYERLSDVKQQRVDKIEAALLDRYTEFHGREPDYADASDLFEIAMSTIQREYARDYMAGEMESTGNPLIQEAEIELDDGATMTVEQAHDILDKIGDLRREDRLTKKHMGLFRDPETKKAEATADIAKLWENDLTGEADE